MIGDVVLSVLHISENINVNNVEIKFIQFDIFLGNSYEYQFIGPLLDALADLWTENPKEKFKVRQLLSFFRLNRNRPFNDEKLCAAQQKLVLSMTQTSHDAKTE